MHTIYRPTETTINRYWCRCRRLASASQIVLVQAKKIDIRCSVLLIRSLLALPFALLIMIFHKWNWTKKRFQHCQLYSELRQQKVDVVADTNWQYTHIRAGYNSGRIVDSSAHSTKLLQKVIISSCFWLAVYIYDPVCDSEIQLPPKFSGCRGTSRPRTGEF